MGLRSSTTSEHVQPHLDDFVEERMKPRLPIRSAPGASQKAG
jgi:hypothetical protein